MLETVINIKPEQVPVFQFEFSPKNQLSKTIVSDATAMSFFSNIQSLM